MKINRLEIENVKRVRALQLEPSPSGLTVIGGRNGQGKTSVLDAIAWALGGDRYRPGTPQREGSTIPPVLRVELSNGIVVERKGKNSALTVTDTTGQKAGQALLDSFVEKLALDLPRFMQQNNKEKADTLLKIIGVEEQLKQLRAQEEKLYNQRHAIGQIADQKAKFAREQPLYADAPMEPVSASALIHQQQDILARNGENQRKREKAALYNRELAEAQKAYENAQARLQQATEDAFTANRDAQDLQDESTAEIEKSIQEIEETNRKVRANLDRARAEEDAQEYRQQYDGLTEQVEQTRKAIRQLLQGAKLPLEELSVDDKGELTYKGFGWSDMSSAEQLQVATAIVRQLNPDCGFVLIDKLEQMDLDTMKGFGAWLEQQGLQAICTRVSTGEECSIVIHDGAALMAEPAKKAWKEGSF